MRIKKTLFLSSWKASQFEVINFLENFHTPKITAFVRIKVFIATK